MFGIIQPLELHQRGTPIAKQTGQLPLVPGYFGQRYRLIPRLQRGPIIPARLKRGRNAYDSAQIILHPEDRRRFARQLVRSRKRPATSRTFWFILPMKITSGLRVRTSSTEYFGY